MTPVAPAARVLIVAGEASGDLYGGLLMRQMAARNGGASPRFTGIGGPSMRDAGLTPLADAAGLAVTGFLEVARHLVTVVRAYRAASAALESPASKPDLAILIDYPDFNLRLAGRARRAGVPVLYLISPQVWAWRRGRLSGMRKVIDRMLVILPFEEAIYREAGIPVEFIGHPLLDLVQTTRTSRQTRALLGLDAGRPLVALLPGSRPNELRALLPPMLDAAARLRGEFRDLQFLLTVAPTMTRAAMERQVAALLPQAASRPVLVVEDRYDAVAASDAAVVASGTATLETALLGVPMVIAYRMNPITYALARRVSRLEHIGMPNLIAGERIVPELIQEACTGTAIAAAVRRLLTDRTAADLMRRQLAGLRDRLGQPGAIDRAARAAWDMIRPVSGSGGGS